MGLTEVVASLKRASIKHGVGNGPSAVTGYTAAYALYLHEHPNAINLGTGKDRPSGLGQFWGPAHYGPKFLEGPAREFSGEIGRDIVAAMSRGATLEEALLVGALRLQRESQERVPVEYGILRASAFSEVDR